MTENVDPEKHGKVEANFMTIKVELDGLAKKLNMTREDLDTLLSNPNEWHTYVETHKYLFE